MSKEFDEFMNGIQKEDKVNKDLKTQADEIIRLKAELGNCRDMSKVAIKIVEYFNQDVTVWDSKMYEQKQAVIMLL